MTELRSCVKVEVAVIGSPPLNGHYGLCGRKATLALNHSLNRFRSINFAVRFPCGILQTEARLGGNCNKRESSGNPRSFGISLKTDLERR